MAYRAGPLLVALSVLGCAHGGPHSARHDRPEGLHAADPARTLPRIYRPQDQRTARHLLERAFSSASEDDPELAAALFHAVLASDFLTDKGRANIYWVTAGIHRRLDDKKGEADALGSFLVASEMLTSDDELETRQLVARSVLAALRVARHPFLGRSPQAAIVVEDTREPASIMASLPCGSEGYGRYIDVAIESIENQGGRLLHRRAECHESGAVLDLWFDLTYADAVED